MLYGEEVKDVSLKHVQGKAARDTLSAIIEWTGNKINTAKKRWIFELLQNAIDTATARKNENLKIEIEKSTNKLIFRHNAGWFQQEEIAAVFYGGSTKPFERDSEYLGRFGTGFLVTHVISRKVTLKAFFIDNHQNILTCPSITIDRTATKETDISDAIDTCFDQLNKQK